jgi:hypothetical protein
MPTPPMMVTPAPIQTFSKSTLELAACVFEARRALEPDREADVGRTAQAGLDP